MKSGSPGLDSDRTHQRPSKLLAKASRFPLMDGPNHADKNCNHYRRHEQQREHTRDLASNIHSNVLKFSPFGFGLLFLACHLDSIANR
ncbi:hypothetical protein GCM10027403_22920 [Arthrobacter tecti]